MKTKIFFLLATMLLTSMCAFAQSENTGTLKGDVNGDGVVDVADINAVIEIMKNGGGTGEETKYYWYAGQVQPQNMSSNPTIDDTNFTVNKWHTLGTATTIAKTITGGTSGNDWYVAVPTSINLKPTATDLSTPNPTWDNLGTITVNEVSYTIWRTNSTGSRSAVYMAGTGEETKYYWYVGTTEPTTSNITSIGNSLSDKPTTWTAQNPKSIEATNDTGSSSYIYYCFPTNWNVVVLDSDKITEMLLADVSTFTLNNTQYTVKRTGRIISNGTTKPYYAKLD